MLPTGAQPVSNSYNIITRMLSSTFRSDPNQNYPDHWIVNTDGRNGWPTYYGQDTDYTYGISCNEYFPCDVASFRGYAPYGATVQGNTTAFTADRHLTFIDQTNKREFDLWHMQILSLPQQSNTTIPTGFSGYTWIQGGNCGSQGCDGRARGVGEGNAGRIGNLAGRIRAEEMLDAVNNSKPNLRHALTIAVNCTNGVAVYPSSTNVGNPCSNTVDAPPMGAWIHLNMTLDQINSLPVPPWKKILLRTLMYYGAYINDTGASGYFSWQTESGNQYIAFNATDQWMVLAQTLRGATDGTNDWYSCTPAPDAWCSTGGYKGLWRDTDDFTAPDTWTTRVWRNLEVLQPPAPAR
jgi:hypothetical protein